MAATEAGDIAVLERELVVLTRLLEAAQRRTAYPMERAHYLVLSLVEAHGPQSIGGLAARLALDDSTVTRQVAAMERAGLLEKQQNPIDRRGMMIEATAHGLKEMRRMRTLRLDRIGRLMRRWDSAERRRFGTLLSAFNASLLDHIGTPAELAER
jgi:DNA-binding MarR family transcriptional regulator